MSALTAAERTLVVTHFPSPYQVELFNEVERVRPGAIQVYYLHRRLTARKWTGVPPLHEHRYLDAGPLELEAARQAMHQFGLVVFNFYNEIIPAKLIRLRQRSGLPWCFWGERPGYRFPWLARLARRGRLSALHAGRQPIWGIGQWAVDAYQQEFGSSRAYVNLPYFSDLARFQRSQPGAPADGTTFLFSGSLSHRKGIEVLAHAFLRLAGVAPRVRLTIMGEGPLDARLRRLLAPCDRVSWLGFRDWNDLPAAYQSAHVLCVPSRHDGWGLVVPEGLASGLPTIATTRTGAALDLIEPGRNGWLIPANSVEALYGAMAEAAGLPVAAWSVLSRGARDSVAGHQLSHGAVRLLNAVDAARTTSGGAV